MRIAVDGVREADDLEQLARRARARLALGHLRTLRPNATFCAAVMFGNRL